MSSFDDLFNLSVEDFKEEKKEKNFERYNPQAKDGEGNVYTAVIRFVPWYKDPKLSSEKQKRVCWLENISTGDKRYVDCPSSVGKDDPLTKLFFKLKNSQSAKDQELSKMFKSSLKFAALVEIIKDKQHPELEGKIMVWQYGITIHDKIHAQMHPEYGKPSIPFDVFNGRPMQLTVTLKGGFNNFDGCQFLSEPMAIKIDGEEVERSAEGMKKVSEFLEKNSPDLDKYGYQEWDAETEAFVKSAIAAAIPGERIMSEITTASSKTASKPAAPKPAQVKEEKEESEDEFSIEDINIDEELSDDDLYSKL